MQKSRKKKGFTLTELAIVIAVIAILIAVLVPTFVTLINKAKESSDSQLAKNMNTLLATAETDSNTPERMEDVNQILVNGGYTIAKLTPSADNNIFVWNEETNRISYISMDDDSKWEVIYAGDSTCTAGEKLTAANKYWVTVESVSEIESWAGLSYYISNESGNFNNQTITLTNAASSIDTGTYTISSIVYTKTASGSVENQTAKTKAGDNNAKAATATKSATTAVVWGIVDNLTVSNGSISVINYASITTKTTVSSATAYTESGYSNELNVSDGVTIEIAKDGMVATLSGKSSSITCSGYIETISGNSITGVTATDKDSYSYTISNYSELISFRNKVNGGMTFADLTVELTADIDISSKTWIPIGYDSRDTAKKQHEATSSTLTYKYFAGTFNGNNHTICGLNNTGFTPTTVRTDTYGNKEGVSNYLYGFFGIINGATITKLNLTNINIVEESIVTDSVGAVAGVATGSVEITYCTTSGSIEGTDAIGGILGRAYPANSNDKIDVEYCTNNCTVTSKGDKAAGIVGFFDYTKINSATTKTIVIKNCTNTGAITADKYVAGISLAENSCGFRSYTVSDCTNTGTLSVSDSKSSCIGYIVGRGGTSTTFTISNSTTEYKWSISGCLSTFTTTASAAKVVWDADGNQVNV